MNTGIGIYKTNCAKYKSLKFDQAKYSHFYSFYYDLASNKDKNGSNLLGLLYAFLVICVSTVHFHFNSKECKYDLTA